MYVVFAKIRKTAINKTFVFHKLSTIAPRVAGLCICLNFK